MSIRLYVGNLPKEDVDRQELHAIFADAGDSVSTKVIKDRKTGKCRGFAFVTVPTDEMADEIIEKHNGQAFKDTTLKIEKALPRSKGGEGEEESTPTPAPNPNATPTPRPNLNPGGGDRTAPSGGGSGRRSSGKKSRKGGSSAPAVTSSGNSDAFQPDPRWAGELAKLKEMLSAQTTNP